MRERHSFPTEALASAELQSASTCVGGRFRERVCRKLEWPGGQLFHRVMAQIEDYALIVTRSVFCRKNMRRAPSGWLETFPHAFPSRCRQHGARPGEATRQRGDMVRSLSSARRNGAPEVAELTRGPHQDRMEQNCGRVGRWDMKRPAPAIVGAIGATWSQNHAP